MENYDVLIVGQPSLDINTDYDGSVMKMLGGAVIYSGYAAAASGAKVAVLPKLNSSVTDPVAAFEKSRGVTVFPVESRECTSISNTYLTADRERRICKAISHIDPYRPADLPEINVKIYHLAGLMVGDIDEAMIDACAARGDCAVDVQCLLRRDEDGNMIFRDWEKKLEYLPKIRYLKTDAAEAEILTGMSDRREAARQLYAWGAKEIMITHNTEVLIYDGKEFYTAPIRSRNLSGRTGRGDTTFAGYLSKRLHEDIASSVLYAAALVSLKMETPGPFMGSEEDVREYIKQFY